VERRAERIDVGLARLEAAVRATRTAGVQAIADHVLGQVLPDQPNDDVVFIVKRLDPTTTGTPTT
jgi:hypothetical protein